MKATNNIKHASDPFTYQSLAKLNYKTPFLIIDTDRLAKRYKEFNTYLKRVNLHYAVKCNPDIGVLKKLNDLGSGFEVASYNECSALENIGVNTSKIIYSAPVKPADDIKKAYKAGVSRFAVDCFSEVEKVAKNAPGSKVYVRVAVSDLGSKWPLSQKFGAPPREVIELMEYAKSLCLQTYGLTFHIGSQSTETNSWDFALQTIGNLMDELTQKGIKIEMVDIGGGFPAKYTEDVPELDEISLVIKKAIKKHLPYEVKIIAEPGRGLVAEAGLIVSSVLSRTIRGNKNWLYLDIGAYNGLIETTSTQGSLVYPIRSSKDNSKDGKSKLSYVITGPTCDSLDTMFGGVQLAKNLAIDDHIYIGSAGAYTLSYASSFNGFKPPKVYYV